MGTLTDEYVGATTASVITTMRTSRGTLTDEVAGVTAASFLTTMRTDRGTLTANCVCVATDCLFVIIAERYLAYGTDAGVDVQAALVEPVPTSVHQ